MASVGSVPAIEAIDLVRNCQTHQVGWLIGVEALVGTVYAVFAFAPFVLLERSARHNATLDVR
jgi:hypothetical protein